MSPDSCASLFKPFLLINRSLHRWRAFRRLNVPSSHIAAYDMADFRWVADGLLVG